MRSVYLTLHFLFLGYFSICQDNGNVANSSQFMSSLNSSGGNTSSTSGAISYSIGQSFYTNVGNFENNLDHGVQQVNEDQPSFISKVDASEVLAYPNPTTDYLIVDLIDFEDDTGLFHLFNVQGKLLKTIEVKTKATKVPMDSLKDGIYILRIAVKNVFEKSINIVKI